MNKKTKILLSLITSSLILVILSGCAAKNSSEDKKSVSVAASIDKTNSEAKPSNGASANNATSDVKENNQEKVPVKAATPSNKPQSASSEKRNIQITEKKTESNNEYIKTTIKYPVISGLDDKSIETKLNAMFENNALNAKKSIEDTAKLEYENSQKEKDVTFRKYEVQTDFNVRYNKNNMLSITGIYYQYTGGAHGGANQVGYNINLKTGELLLLPDIFDKGFDYKDTIVNEILDSIKKGEKIYFNDAATVVKGIDENRSYYIEEGNIVIYYGQYEIAPYASGMPEFKIPLSKLKLREGLMK